MKSNIRFNGVFKEELQKTVDALEETIESDLGNYFHVDSVLSGTNNLKIRINDETQGIQRIINCIFRYHHDDEWYGIIHIELVSSELSKKPRSHFVGKFNVVDRKKIIEAVFADLLVCIRAIY